MTEVEAKTKWCPMAGERGGGSFREDCMGSRCACWVWNEAPCLRKQSRLPYPKPGELEEVPPVEQFDHPKGSGWEVAGEPDDDGCGFYLQFVRERDPERPGRCGLAR